jgi:hypothetical protein
MNVALVRARAQKVKPKSKETSFAFCSSPASGAALWLRDLCWIEKNVIANPKTKVIKQYASHSAITALNIGSAINQAIICEKAA